MPRWTISDPTTVDFDGVVMLKVTLVAGGVSVLATDDMPSVRVTDVVGRPLLVSREAGIVEITHEVLEGVLGWIRRERTSATVTVLVPRECPVQLNLVSAEALVTGLTARVSVRTGSGDVTLDGVAGRIDANTVSGSLETRGLEGAVSFRSVSGDLTLAGGALDRLTARSLSGKVAADISLNDGGRVQVGTASGEVSLRLPTSTSATVELTSTIGRVESAFPELSAGGRSVSTNLTGTLGDGAGHLSVTTVSGNVTLLGGTDDPVPLPGASDVED